VEALGCPLAAAPLSRYEARARRIEEGTLRRHKLGYGLATGGSLWVIAFVAWAAVMDASDEQWARFVIDLIIGSPYIPLLGFFAWRFRQSFR
jgi:hypothetical protein